MKGLLVSSAGSALIASVMAGSSTNGKLSAIVYPLQSRQVTSTYGQRVDPITGKNAFHSGVDIAAAHGTDIRAISGGVVLYAGVLGGYGRLVSVRHQGGITTHYGHCESLLVRVGEKVRAGQKIALVGSTGRVTGPHLHLETRVLGAPMDPRSILSALRSAEDSNK
jgi:murein DD-endopeptidase MepM/ murein hydrolase activator NlpD